MHLLLHTHHGGLRGVEVGAAEVGAITDGSELDALEVDEDTRDLADLREGRVADARSGAAHHARREA
jgi:hypothetical protein